MGSGPRGRLRGRAVPSGTVPLGLCGATSRGPGALQEPGADGPVAGPAVDSGWVMPSQAPLPSATASNGRVPSASWTAVWTSVCYSAACPDPL